MTGVFLGILGGEGRLNIIVSEVYRTWSAAFHQWQFHSRALPGNRRGAEFMSDGACEEIFQSLPPGSRFGLCGAQELGRQLNRGAHKSILTATSRHERPIPGVRAGAVGNRG